MSRHGVPRQASTLYYDPDGGRAIGDRAVRGGGSANTGADDELCKRLAASGGGGGGTGYANLTTSAHARAETGAGRNKQDHPRKSRRRLPSLLLAFVTEKGSATHEDTGESTICEKAATVMKMLRASQTLFELEGPAADPPGVSAAVHADAQEMRCPGVSDDVDVLNSAAAPPGPHISYPFHLVAFIDIDFILTHNVTWQETLLEKMVLAASMSHASATLVSIHPASSASAAAHLTSRSFDGAAAGAAAVCVKSSSSSSSSSAPYARHRHTCHFYGSPLLVRVPVGGGGMINARELVKRVLGTRTGGPDREHDAVAGAKHASTDTMGQVFCSAVDSDMHVHALRELEHLVSVDSRLSRLARAPAMPENNNSNRNNNNSHPLNAAAAAAAAAAPIATLTMTMCQDLGAPDPLRREVWSRVVAAAAAPAAAARPGAQPDALDHGAAYPRELAADDQAPHAQQQQGFMLMVPWLEHGGADQFNVNLARALSKLGIRVVVVTTLKSTHPIARAFYAVTPDIFHLDQLIDGLLRNRSKAMFVLEHLFASRSVHVVMISHSAYAYALLPDMRRSSSAADMHLATRPNHPTEKRIAKSSRTFVDFVHLEEPDWGDGGYAALSVASAKYLDHTFAASQHVADWMQKRARSHHHRHQSAAATGPIDDRGGIGVAKSGRRRQHTSVAYIGVDTHALRPLPERERSLLRARFFPARQHHQQQHHRPVDVDDGDHDDDDKARRQQSPRKQQNKTPSPAPVVIAYLARMVDQKLPHVYFEILRQLKVDRGLDFVSVAIGDGERLGELRANISRQPLLRDRVLTYGMLDHEASMRILAASDILLLPSRNEGISLAAYEAMALGVVPVVSAVGGQCELVSGDAGACLFFDANAAAEAASNAAAAARLPAAVAPFVDALEQLIRCPALLNKGRRAARARVEREFGIDRMVQALHKGVCVG